MITAQTTREATTAVVTMITDPRLRPRVGRVVGSITGCRRLEGSPTADGTPYGSRTVFQIDHADLAAGGLDAHIDVLHAHGINVHRILGEHPAVQPREPSPRLSVNADRSTE